MKKRAFDINAVVQRVRMLALEVLQSFAGVGPKCANLALGVAAGVARISVDVHVPFGKHVCTGVRPKCSVCPVLEYCRQIGVTEHR